MDSVSSHSVYVLQQLQEQRIQGLLCDCMLVVKGVSFKAHKNVLAAFSAYFRSLFQNSPAQKSDVFHLAIQDVGGIGQVLDYMYTSHLELNQDNVHALLEIGQSLQVLNILNMCQAFLKPCVSTDAALSLPADAAHDQDCVIGGSLPSDADLHKPLPHGYKLRNFYTRQYLKQSCSLPPEEPLQSSIPKTVYLKKFNYLRSHVSAEDEGVEHCDPRGATPTHPAHASDLSVTSDPAEVSELKTTPAAETDDLRGHVERSEVSSGNKYCCETHTHTLTLKHTHTQLSCSRSSLSAGEKPFQCNVCGKGFSQVCKHTNTCLTRSCCIFAASGDVQRHIIIHSGARPHLCDICGRGFSNFSNLKEHKKTHSTEKEFTCEQCGKSFNMQRKLFKHKLRHSGDKPYSCQTCGKCFAGSGDLQRHVRSHTGERPYTCDTCGKSFTRTAVLRRHRSSHCSRADADASCRSPEELSSGALWGHAMKTLQNHTEH
uniref:Zinc finger and BTB domain containing 49 n=1 Tax=Sinocyclocheilus anshuiensis TaxID=1608454 RepID=A0A671LAQ0_9TELE